MVLMPENKPLQNYVYNKGNKTSFFILFYLLTTIVSETIHFFLFTKI